MQLGKRQRRERAEQARQEITSRYAMEALDPRELIARLGEDDFDVAGAASDALFARGAAALDALVDGLKHANGGVRASCALLLDHLGDDRCVEPLCHALRHDPLEAVRRCALHALACQNCKVCPLRADIIGPLLEAALTDRSKQVRRRAMQYLVGQRPDARVVTAAEALLRTEADPMLRVRALRALRWHQQEKSLEGAGATTA